ncbi:uncharacterized protein LOC107484813 [Arachis duranensis]|uniref:Uncharacterized protein LOC107484813 n=1 Tax=Arachis duranensis TaxID=130453 RepID=A0A6P4D1F6_ARADU|nr:uncharacterized protein LOC107484813 [Arachis duranensis]
MKDPFFLSSANQPGLTLVTQQITEENYNSWSRAMKKALNAKHKLGFINGLVSRPDPELDAEQFETWQCVNDIVIIWILNSVSKEIVASLVYTDSAEELWNDLKEKFQHGNGSRIFEFKRDLVNLSQGLDDSYAHIRGQILLMEPLPSINEVLSLVVQEEKHRAIGASSPQLNLLSLQEISMCLHSLEEEEKMRKRGRDSSMHGLKQVAHNVIGGESQLAQDSSSNLTMNASQVQQLIQSLNSKKLQEIASNATTQVVTPVGIVLIASLTRSTSSKQDWILDSGATIHIACDLSLFQTIHTSQNYSVSLPNNEQFQANFIRTVVVCSNITLKNVLYVPDFCVNLLSVSAFLSNTTFDITISSSNFTIQDTKMLKKIGKGCIKAFYAMIKTQFSKKIKCFRSDNAKELAATDFLQEKGVLHHFSCPYRPQQNAVVERKHQHLLNVARALYFQSQVPITFLGECVSTAAFLINRTPSSLLKMKSPFELLFEKSPNYKAMKIFGCLAYATTNTSSRLKFDPRADTTVFFGYPFGYKGYKLYNLRTKQFLISMDVIFHEDTMPFAQNPHTQLNNDIFFDVVLPNPILDSEPLPNAPTIPSVPKIPQPSTTTNTQSQILPLIENQISPSTSIQPRRSTRTKHTPSYLHDYICHTKSPYPISNFISNHRLNHTYHNSIY